VKRVKKTFVLKKKSRVVRPARHFPSVFPTETVNASIHLITMSVTSVAYIIPFTMPTQKNIG